MKISPDNMKWALRMATILVVVTLIDALVVLFDVHPLPWAVIIPAAIPLLTAIFVIIPFINANKAIDTAKD
jgi:hypothetical protein